MRIGVLSDTHNRLKQTRLATQRLLDEGAKYLLHAGDIGQNVLDFLERLPVRTIAVLGNTDMSLNVEYCRNVIVQKEPYYFSLGSKTFKLMHHPYYLTPDSDIVVYGHLHRFECQKAKSLFLNPGEVCAREKPRIECAMLDTVNMSVEYHYYEQERWKKEEICP